MVCLARGRAGLRRPGVAMLHAAHAHAHAHAPARGASLAARGSGRRRRLPRLVVGSARPAARDALAAAFYEAIRVGSLRSSASGAYSGPSAVQLASAARHALGEAGDGWRDDHAASAALVSHLARLGRLVGAAGPQQVLARAPGHVLRAPLGAVAAAVARGARGARGAGAAVSVERRIALLGDELEPSSGGEALRERPPHAGRTSGEGRVDETYRRLVEEQRQTVHHSQGIE